MPRIEGEKMTKIQRINIPRTHIEGAVYYVTSRGDNNQEIFKDNEDYKKYLELLRKYKEQYGFKLFAFVLMPNHLHLLIGLKKDITLSDIMHDLNANYTKYFNGRRQRKGHLFQERYKMNLLEKTPYFLFWITAYMHLNPKVSGLVSDIKEYIYSSYPLYISKEDATVNKQLFDMQNEVKEGLEYLEEKDYAGYLNGISKEEMESFGRDLTKKPVLGSSEFIEKVQSEVNMQQASLNPIKNGVPAFTFKRIVLAGSATILILGIFSVYLFSTTKAAKENLNKELSQGKIELSEKLKQDREFIKKDLDEKYRADLVSYQAMAKRLEIEKNKVKHLENKIE